MRRFNEYIEETECPEETLHNGCKWYKLKQTDIYFSGDGENIDKSTAYCAQCHKWEI